MPRPTQSLPTSPMDILLMSGAVSIRRTDSTVRPEATAASRRLSRRLFLSSEIRRAVGQGRRVGFLAWANLFFFSLFTGPKRRSTSAMASARA